ncbi:hypothetical protein K438DRAFT_1980406 [Mycena galopus ATCC 62051]|nr:hypothetical protein K438DRAFT_1980406 [Mycena galopus ATCC 62051]
MYAALIMRGSGYHPVWSRGGPEALSALRRLPLPLPTVGGSVRSCPTGWLHVQRCWPQSLDIAHPYTHLCSAGMGCRRATHPPLLLRLQCGTASCSHPLHLISCDAIRARSPDHVRRRMPSSLRRIRAPIAPLLRRANPYAPLWSGSYGLSQSYTPRCCSACDAAPHSPAPDMQLVRRTDAGARCLAVI